ncbi:MAG: FtsX-like permease family protein [Candidatus Cloacimonetes bacterium]|nr:FtsX-like permease family protein [Candidatus Cloacimonadota bacterium]MDD3234726.1 FtsX-like permease family protein [Candidatus Cloacimonadota bacterium]
MIFKLAFKSIFGNGWRSLINIIILSIVLTGMVWMQGLLDGWGRTARRQMQDWEFGAGHFEHSGYDKYDSFTLDSSYAPVPADIQSMVAENKAVPILISNGVIYPQGRLTPITIKGIPASQTLLKIPTEFLKDKADSSGETPAIIGKAMAKSIGIMEGETITMRWKDVHGVYNATDLIITHIMDTPVPSIDISQVWIDYDKLNAMKALSNNATMLILKDKMTNTSIGNTWKYVSIDNSMEGTDALINAKRAGGYVMFVLLLFLAMVAIFDTQILSIFKRRKEIGTLIALGLTKGQIVRLFTLEGSMYMLLAVVFTGIFGMPLFLYFGLSGYKIPPSMTDLNIAGTMEPIMCYYSPSMLLSTFIIVLCVTAFASWLPASKIARMRATDALLGKV